MKTGQQTLLVILALALACSVARAGVDAPGGMTLDFTADDSTVFEDWSELPGDAVQLSATAYFSTDASSFGEDGVFIWAGFEFMKDDQRRYGMLLVDLDMSQAPLDGETPLPHEAVRAEYIEKWGDQIYFQGQVAFGDVWLVDIFFNQDDDGALEGDLALVFDDPSGRFPGCRALVRGAFASRPSPSTLRRNMGIAEGSTGGTTYVDTGCNGDVYLADNSGEGCDCGGNDPETSGCEGDTGGSGCEGDSGGSGCEGDSGGSSCSGSSGGCEGDLGGGSCSGGGGSTCAIAGAHRRLHGPLRRAMRFFPQLFVLLYIVLIKKRTGKSS
ncbi:MAG TPA: hypothetical protein VM425_04575 [Myxococcota bacterium]|nr:hypothetical protein [Myxococcota bacterium]